MKGKRILTILLVFVVILFIMGNALRTAWLPHVKTAIVTSGSISYSFSGGEVLEADNQKYLLEVDSVYADCFSVGSQPRWIPYSDTGLVQMMQVTALETKDSTCRVTLEGVWIPGTVPIQEGSIQVDSPLYPALVPRAAFVSEDIVYIMQEDFSAGKVKNVVVTCKVKAAPGNEQYIPCTAGISAGTQVLVAWDRSLIMGGQVEIVSTIGAN